MLRPTKMRQMKDVGKFFEKNLNQGEKKPNENVWERINQSLDAEKLRRKRNLTYWLVGFGLFFSLGFLIVDNGNLLPSNFIENNLTLVKKTNNSSEKQSEAGVLKISKEDSLSRNNSNENLTTPEAATRNLKLIKIQDSSKIKQEQKQRDYGIKSKKDKSRNNNIDESFNVTTNYHYYNSEDGKQVRTTRKEEIDSLILGTQKSLDTLSVKKTEPIQQ